MKKIFIVIFMFGAWFTRAQTITLRQCIDSALVHYPLSGQKELFRNITDMELAKINSGNLPQIDFSAKATWQNEVTKVPVNVPGLDIPQVSKDQYKAQLEISQALYKGGLTKAQKALAGVDEEIGNAEVEIDFNKLKYNVINLYYQLILNNEFKEVSLTYKTTLESNLEEMQAAVDEGALLPSDADVLKVELLTIEQKLQQLEIERKSLAERMQLYTGITLTAETNLAMPDSAADLNLPQQRPEYTLMELNRRRLSVMRDFSFAKGRPKAFAFSTLGYGRPGFDFLSDDFAPYALVGVGISWNLWNWGTFKKERRILELNDKIIANRQEAFLTELNTGLNRMRAEMATQKMMLQKARKIAGLRKEIARSALVKLKNGTITTARYVDEVQKYEKARLDTEIYRIKLSVAVTNYLWMLGRL